MHFCHAEFRHYLKKCVNKVQLHRCIRVYSDKALNDKSIILVLAAPNALDTWPVADL